MLTLLVLSYILCALETNQQLQCNSKADPRFQAGILYIANFFKIPNEFEEILFC